MKKKWLCMYLTVVMLATTLSPADAMAEDFTDVSSDENGSVAEQELNGENVFDVTDESYVDAYENTEAGAGEETLISDGTTTKHRQYLMRQNKMTRWIQSLYQMKWKKAWNQICLLTRQKSWI